MPHKNLLEIKKILKEQNLNKLTNQDILLSNLNEIEIDINNLSINDKQELNNILEKIKFLLENDLHKNDIKINSQEINELMLNLEVKHPKIIIFIQNISSTLSNIGI